MITLIDERLSKCEWVHGDCMGIMDVSLYGMTSVFRSSHATSGYNYVCHKSTKFCAWFDKMDRIVKDRLGGEFTNK
jgi:glutathione S-transferase